MGLSRRDGLGLSVLEHGPIVLIAGLGGIALGLGIFVLVEPGLGLDGLIGSAVEVPFSVDARQMAAILGLRPRGRGGRRAAGNMDRAARRADPGPARRSGLMTDLDRRGSAGPGPVAEPDDAGIPEVEIIDLPTGGRGGGSFAGSAGSAGPSPSPTLPRTADRRWRAADGRQIVCEGLVRIYKVADLEVVALQGLDLLVDGGEMIAIVGASGSGKSTLLNILGGLDAPSAGRAVVAGHDLGAARAARSGRATGAASSGSSGSRRPATCCRT